MRAPVLNDRGQFRYSDFVAYIPEYLKAEPDVVTLLQVFSDYINNAYRNIETVEKFEFAIVTRADTLGRATRKMEYLRTMLDLAGSRRDFVNLLSSPRANIKTNRIFGQSTGYIPTVVDYTANEVLDEIPNASHVLHDIGAYEDGDVVFISYDAIDNGAKEVAYYYDARQNALIREPMGASQDPFTGSYNTNSRIISFHVSDVSSVKTRYGYTSENGTQYKELFFTARIFDVQSAPAVKRVTLNGGIEAVIDYYGTETPSRGVINSTMRFFDSDGWNWKNGFPTAMIYLSETSGARLTATSEDNKKYLPFGLCADPSITKEVSKYTVTKLTEGTDGTLVATLDTFYPSYSNGTVFLALKKTMEMFGPFSVIRDVRESGSYNVALIPTGTAPLLDMNAEYVIVDVPLFYDRGMLDYVNSSPIINLGNIYPVKIAGNGSGITKSSLFPGEDVSAYAYDAEENEVAGTLNICNRSGSGQPEDCAYMNGSTTIVVPFSSTLGKNFGVKYDIGDELYIREGYMYWNGIATVKSVVVVDEGYAITLQGVAVHPHQLVTSVEVCVNRHGYLTLATESGKQKVEWGSHLGRYEKEGAIVVFDKITSTPSPYDTRKYVRVLDDQSKYDELGLPDGSYAVSTLKKTGSYAKTLIDITGNSTVWEKSRGDMFTCRYVMISDGNGNESLCDIYFAPGKEVVPLESGVEYHKGQYVFSHADNKVYLCVDDCIVTDRDTVTKSKCFSEDRIAHYSVPYVEKINAFAPFYGQIFAMDFGSSIDYSVDPEVFLSPLYITKVDEKRLKYGWEHREFLNYGDDMNLSGRSRNGMAEFYSTERTNGAYAGTVSVDSSMDIVNTDLSERAAWSYTHSVVTHGCTGSIPIDIDDREFLTVSRVDDTHWKVTVHSSAHGLIDGSDVTVSGMSIVTLRNGTLDINSTCTPVDVVDGDTFTYVVTGNKGISGKVCYASFAGGSISYIQDHHVTVVKVAATGDGVHVKFGNIVNGIRQGDSVFLDGCHVTNGSTETPYPAGPYSVVSVDDDLFGIVIQVPSGTMPELGEGSIVRKKISEYDIVMVTDTSGTPQKFYEVTSGAWMEVDRGGLITPVTLFSQHNMFDITETNPVFAYGDKISIGDIIYTGNNRATVHLTKALPHFIPENKQYIEGKTVVYITNVTPSDFCGYHVVTRVNSPTSFEIEMRLYNKKNPDVDSQVGIPTGDLQMTLQECRWYKYTIDEIEWEKTSSVATFTGNNVTTVAPYDTDGNEKKLLCAHVHGLSVGDYAVFGTDFSKFEESTGLTDYAMGKVVKVVDDTTVIVDIIYGTYSDCMSIARGIITQEGMDNLSRRNGEYGIRIRSLHGNSASSSDYDTSKTWVMYNFRDGDIVLAMGQLVPSERVAYLVRENAQWTVLKKKRIMKIRDISVDEYPNAAYQDASAEDNVDEYKYTTYSDVDVAKASAWAYASRMFMVRNPVFNKPAISGIDTTREINAEYSSGEDYGNVAPRDDMKASFAGVPDMKYPLIEKIERLAYLRDASVIDFDLIGYLARFMGYDLTPMAEDIESSNLYRTVKEREQAIREAVMNLPQYYALGGTEPGIKMIMGAFGVIGDILTLYTNTMGPYGEMLNKEEVKNRVASDTENGTLKGTWVSTPYIDIELTDDARYPQFSIQPDDIARIKEQIRFWKPINVVFRDVLLRYVCEMDCTASIIGPFVGIGEFGTAIGLGDGNTDTMVEPDYVEPWLTNCAF